MNGQGANTYKTPKAGKEWLWSNVTFFPRNYSWLVEGWKGRREGRVTGDIGEREAGERKFPILFADWTTGGDFEGKKKKSDRCSRSCVGSTDAHRRRILQVKETNHPVTFTPIFVRQTRLSIRLSHASRKSRLETRPLSPLAPVFDRNLWKERKIADRSNSPISRSVSRSNVIE